MVLVTRRYSVKRQDWTLADYCVKQHDVIVGRRKLVLTSYELSIEDYASAVRLDTLEYRAGVLKNRLWEIRHGKGGAKPLFQNPIFLPRIPGYMAAADPIRVIRKGNRTMTDGPDDFVPRPEVLKRFGDIPVGIEVEDSTQPASHVN
jgi:hypothetical protein